MSKDNIMIVGLLNSKEDAEEVKFIAKLLLVGNRARFLGGQGREERK